MKLKYWLCSIGAGGALLAATFLPSRSIDTSCLQRRFQFAEPPAQCCAEQAALAVHRTDYPRAIHELKRLFADRRTTPEQRRAVRDLIARVERSAARHGIALSTEPAARVPVHIEVVAD